MALQEKEKKEYKILALIGVFTGRRVPEGGEVTGTALRRTVTLLLMARACSLIKCQLMRLSRRSEPPTAAFNGASAKQRSHSSMAIEPIEQFP